MSFWDFFPRKRAASQNREVVFDCRELLDLDGLEFSFREAAFWMCVDIVANALGKCEMKQFENRRAIRGTEYWRWNYEPNKNQNASEFWHKLVAHLFKDGDALVVAEPYGDGFCVADEFDIDDDRPVYVYRHVRIGKREPIKRISEGDVMYIRLNHRNIEPIISKMNDSFLRLMKTAMQNYQFSGGQHWKAHVSQMITADSEWITNFQAMLEKQITPFLNSSSAVLPEPEGYKYEQISGGDASAVNSTEIRALAAQILDETARAFLIPPSLLNGTVQDTSEASKQFLSNVVDPIAKQITQEANRKRYGREEVLNGDYLFLDTSGISHFDILANASNVEKLISSGVWSVNELREIIGNAPVDEDWADKHFLTKNIGTIETAT